jgi:hypothetical protein
MATVPDLLSTYLEPIAEELTPRQAEKILAITPPSELIAKVQELAEKANLGTLTPDEVAEYSYYVDVDDVIGLLKAKARNLLGRAAS